jgi:hypothetical protein
VSGDCHTLPSAARGSLRRQDGIGSAQEGGCAEEDVARCGGEAACWAFISPESCITRRFRVYLACARQDSPAPRRNLALSFS